MTELGDAELTEQGIIALSGHCTAEATEQDVDESRNRPPAEASECG